MIVGMGRIRRYEDRSGYAMRVRLPGPGQVLLHRQGTEAVRVRGVGKPLTNDHRSGLGHRTGSDAIRQASPSSQERHRLIGCERPDINASAQVDHLRPIRGGGTMADMTKRLPKLSE